MICVRSCYCRPSDRVQLCLRPASTPPFSGAPKFYIRYAHPISLRCHQLYIVIVANAFGCPGELFWLARGIVLGVEMKHLRTCLTYASLTYASSLSFLPMPPLKHCLYNCQ